MPANEPAVERNLDGYGAPPIPWSKVRNRLDQGFTQPPGTGGPSRHTFWLATVNPDSSPHVMPLGVLWIDGAFYFNSGPGTTKSKNLSRYPRCVLTVATDPFDLVIEGEAVRVTEEAKLKRIAEAYAGVGWSPRSAMAPSTPSTARPPRDGRPGTSTKSGLPRFYALGTGEPFGATRFRF